jgi:ferredoxin
MADYNDHCVGCGAQFMKHRIDKMFCCRACQMRNYRRAEKERLHRLELKIRRAMGRESIIMKDLFA